MKTLIISYLPRGEQSNTKKLADHFLKEIKGKDIETLDLIKESPDLLFPKNLSAYMKRNYGKQPLTREEKKSVQKMDDMTKQFKEADIVVIAYPMYNFSQPATVKAYFDSILLKGETWDIGEKGYAGLMKGKKALILTSSGGIYEGTNASMDHSTTLSENLFRFMGFEDIRIVNAAGINMMPQKAGEIIEKCKQEISKTVKDWY